ncbi:MAG TPA: O-antigen ligase family protein [Blastocatellia bacterium]|nr:O-antigen ligase family protein [Blastocatellia bacterium]
MLVALITIGGLLWLLLFRFRERFMRAYGSFFLILLFYVLNKGGESEVDELATGTFSPLSLARWGCLGLLFVIAIRLPRPEGIRADIPLTVLVSLFLSYILLSTTYADDFSYSFMRAASFTALAVAIGAGFVHHFYWRVNCVRFFQFHYYLAWLVMAPALLLHLVGLNRFGAAVLGGQYAGAFGNQNLLGVFSALITPYVLFHWRAEAQTPRRKWMDVALLAVIFAGLGLSRSRGGMLACIIAIATYFLVVKIESSIKIIAITLSLIIIIAAFPSLKQSLTAFIRKDTVERAEIEGIGKQIVEERRYELWKNVAPLYWEQKISGYGFAMSHLMTFPFSGDKEVGRHVHNSYLELFGDLGLPGLLLLLLILGGLAVKSLKLIERRGNLLQRNINAVFISIFASGVVNAFFESWMFSVGNIVALMFWAPIAGIVAQWAWRTVAAEDRVEIAVPTLELGRPMLEHQAK